LCAANAARENSTIRDLSDKPQSARSICVHPFLSAFIGGLLFSNEKSPRRHGAGSFLALFSH
jgi:hypothetical protein